MAKPPPKRNLSLLAKALSCFTSYPLSSADLTVSLAARWKVDELDAILQASTDPNACPRQLLAIRQAAAMVVKNPTLHGSTKELRQSKAWATFKTVELRMGLANKRVSHFTGHRLHRLGHVGQILADARYQIFRLLGDKPTGSEFMATVESARFGPGSVQGRYSRGGVTDVTPYGKLHPQTVVTSTEQCFLYWAPFLTGAFRHWIQDREVQIVDACRGVCVPKDAHTDRFIAVEPYLNSYIQLGQMAVLERRLRKWGVTLEDQSRNQEMARVASLTPFPGGWATLDLSSASDSLSYKLVEWLLPPYWFKYFNSTRCPKIVYGKEEMVLEKFSSMGNGNTFPLETLVFSALILACRRFTGCDQSWAVYGDDMVVSHRIVPLLMEVLKFCGMQVNKQKSYVTGSFRESCGSDYLAGHSVRPTYLKGSLSDLTELFSFHNSLQARDPYLGSPILSTLREGLTRYAGPATTPSGTDSTHLVAPLSVLRRRGQVWWPRDSEDLSRPNFQTWKCRYVAVDEVRPKVRRSEKQSVGAERAYLAFLHSGMLSDPHVVRGNVSLRERVRVSQNLFWLAQYDPSWD